MVAVLTSVGLRNKYQMKKGNVAIEMNSTDNRIS